MKIIALLIAAFLVLLGLTGILWPEGLMNLLVYSFSPKGLYVIAIARMLVGVLLFVAARATRTPRTVRVIAILLFVAGAATMAITTEQAQTFKDWWLAKGPDALRILACLPLAAGVFLGGTTLTKNPRF